MIRSSLSRSSDRPGRGGGVRGSGRRCARLAAWLGASLLSVAAGAQELGAGVQLHGFASQGAVWTSDHRVGGAKDGSVGLDLRELGANLSWRPDPDWLLSGQVLARWAGDTDDGEPRVDYAYIDRSWRLHEASRVGIRLGKIKNPYGFFNVTRDVAHTRPGVIMPQSIYLDQIRNFVLAAPGIALHGDSDMSFGSLSWQLGALRPQVDDADMEYMFLLGDMPGRFQGTNSWMGQVLVEPDGGRWRLGLSVGELNMRYRAGSPDPLRPGRHTLPTWALSVEHNDEHWSVTGEYAQTTNQARGYGPIMDPNPDNTLEAWYVQATRRFGQDWRAYARYDVLYLDRKDRDGARFAVLTGRPGHTRYARDWVLGMRRDIDRFALWLEYHHVDGTAWLAGIDNPDPQRRKRAWDMVLLQAAWYF